MKLVDGRPLSTLLGIRQMRARVCLLCLVWTAWGPQLQSSAALAPTRQFGQGSRRAVAFAPDGRTVLLAGTEAQVFDAETGALLRQFLGHSDTVNSAVFSADGKMIVTGSSDRTARFWD